jgi:hypothetical protein
VTLRSGAAYAALFGLVVVVGLAVQTRLAAPASDAAVLCLVSDSAFVSAGELGDLVDMGDAGVFHVLPFGLGHAYNPAGRSFVAGRSKGFISSLALSGAYRQEADAAARALGYTPGVWPLVPLTGSIVSDNPGVLEVYQTNLAFGDSGGADAFVTATVASASNPHRVTEDGVPAPTYAVSPIDLGDRGTAMVEPPSPADGQHEFSVGVNVRWRVFVVQVTVRGGAMTGTGDGTRIMRLAFGRASAGCSASDSDH